MRGGHRATVAVVDDDAAVRDSLRFLLETVGFIVMTFDSACDFLAAPDRHHSTYVLVDQHMPRVTGLDLLIRLRDLRTTATVALMTGSPSDELSERAFALGAEAVLEKPLAEAVLLRFLGLGDNDSGLAIRPL